MKKTLIIICLLMPLCGIAQQQVLNTQYIYNRLLINPGYTGMDDILSITAFARDQWGGLEGAPNTQSFSIHSPINTDKTAALGGLFVRDEVGVTVQYQAYITGSYKLQVGAKSFLSVGMQGGFVNNQVNYSELPEFARDPSFSEGDVNDLSPSFGFGLYYFSSKFHLGISVPNFIQRRLDQVDIDANSNADRVYYLDFGYQFRLNSDLTLDTNTLWRVLVGDPTQFDVNAILGIREKVWVGTSYRSFDSVSALFRVKLDDDFFLGYSYDFAATTDLSIVSTGSHEFMLQFKLNKK